MSRLVVGDKKVEQRRETVVKSKKSDRRPLVVGRMADFVVVVTFAHVDSHTLDSWYRLHPLALNTIESHTRATMVFEMALHMCLVDHYRYSLGGRKRVGLCKQAGYHCTNLAMVDFVADWDTLPLDGGRL